MNPPPPDPVSPGGEDIDCADRAVAGYLLLERRRFELLGGWVTTIAELDVKAALAAHARHHAWHAWLWEEHLPRRSGYRPGASAPSPRLVTCLDALGGPGGPTDTAERLAGAYRVVAARAVAGYARYLTRLSSVSDPALARTCRLVLSDQVSDWHEGEALLQSLLDLDHRAVQRAAARQSDLERLAIAGHV